MYSGHLLFSLAVWLGVGACTPAELHIGGGHVGRATAAQLTDAREIVEQAQAESDKLNGARMDNPVHNTYWKGRKGWVEVPPLLEITPEIASAATLLTNAEGPLGAVVGNASLSVKKRAGGFWMETISRKGTVPWGDDPSYKVFRNVVEYGADPTGQKDSADAINKAISDGKRCGAKCNGSTIKNAIVYIPAGTYKISRPIMVLFGTQLIGDATNWPLIQASSNFIGEGAMETDRYIGGTQPGPDGKDAQYYVNTANFYRQIRNFKVDITAASNSRSNISCIHYQVAQATSIWNMELIAKRGGTQRGMFAENGSGGVMSDITFKGGRYGFYGGNQQFSSMRLRFEDCDTAAQILWDWGWVWKSTTVKNCNEGFRLVSPDGTGSIGSVSFVDSTFSGTKKAIIMGKPSDKPGTNTTGIILDNTVIDGTIEDVTGKQYASAGSYKSWVFGPTYSSDGKRSFVTGEAKEYSRQSSLQGGSANGLPLKPYFERERPQYTDKGPGDFIHMKDYAKGDGSTDDTKGVQNAFNAVADGSKILYVDAGTYLIGDTVTIPKDAKVVGETWAQFAAFGQKFSDPKNPRVMLKVGNAKDVGTVEMQDLILTTKGATAGAILLEWNVRAKTQGSAALWDVHARIGGALGTGLTEKECPSSQTTPTSQCQAASLMMHLTQDASGYFENMWLWTADHNIDDPNLDDAYNEMPFTSVYVARGFLIESKYATWLYGTASEHATLYQYNFAHAQNIYTTMIQTESPYYQPTPSPPAPWKDVLRLKGVFETDPEFNCAKDGDFSGCDESWAVILTNSQNIHIGGAGTYSWFSYYSQDCIDTHTCQKVLWYVKDNYDNVRVQHIIGIGAKYVLYSEGKGILATDNLATTAHPSWSQISIYDAPSKGKDPDSPDVCNANDHKYDPKDLPDRLGQYRDPIFEISGDAPWPEATFITIVNLTPYRFKFRKDLSNQCQVKGDMGDVPPGHARQMRVDYNTKGTVRVDDNADYYFDVEGTNHRFHIKATQNDKEKYYYRTIWDMNEWGLGYREFKHEASEVAVNFVITGSEEYGYYTSMDWAASPTGWMRALYPVIKDRQLRHVIMPGTHDSGMSKMSHMWTGVPANTQTQGLSFYNQLVAGARYFDLRVVEYRDSNPEYLAAHLNDELSGNGLGGSGESLQDIIDGINQFTKENPGEVIFLWTRYLNRISNAIVGHKADTRLMNLWFEKFKGINNRCPGFQDGEKIQKRKMTELMDANNGNGCVIIIFDNNRSREPNAPKSLPSEGIYDDTHMDRFDHWSETNDIKFLVEDQTKEYAGIRVRSEESGKDKFQISQWLLTPKMLDVVFGPPLDRAALHTANQLLYFFGVNAMTPEGYPSVMMVDYFGLSLMDDYGSWDVRDPSLRALIIGLNLYMASQNCYVSNVKFPLLAPKVSVNNFHAAVAGRPGPKAKQWNGVIFANGTRYESPPPGFDPNPTLMAGMRFMNGSIVEPDGGFHAMDC